MVPRPLLTGVLLLLVPAALLYALGSGSVALPLSDILDALVTPGSLEATLVRDLRLPRALTAFAVGAMLALSGALLQVLLRNPLADPYVLGVSGGAAVAMLAASLLGIGAAFLGLIGFAGATVSMLLVFGLARLGGAGSTTRLLLTGVVLAAGWGAGISLLLALTPTPQLQGVVFWLLGDLSTAQRPALPSAVAAVGLLLSLLLARPLNVLMRGEAVAAALGERPRRLRLAIYFLASLLTAAAVAAAGSIGFVGLIVPHLLRLLSGSDHRYLLLHSALLGGSFLVIADTLARTVLAPLQLPVGVLTALIGVPVFLFLLSRRGVNAAANRP